MLHCGVLPPFGGLYIKSIDRGIIMMSHTTRRQFTLAIIVLAVFGDRPVAAQWINEDIKIVATDAARGDAFGWSVAISGSTAIVGAWQDNDDDTGNSSGSAYLFDAETGDQITKFTASDAQR